MTIRLMKYIIVIRSLEFPMFLILQKYKRIILTTLLFICAYFLGAGIAVYRNAYGKIEEKAENWGLGFTTEGKPPQGNATADELKRYDAYYIGDTSKKVIYLTFDAGYENGYTAQILEALKKHNVRATFFLVGNYIATSPILVRQMVEEGHTVANHTFSHPNMSAISSLEGFSEELKKLEKIYQDVTGQQMVKFYRPPQGKYSIENLQMAKELGYKTFFWSLAYVDWYNNKQPTKEEAFKKLLGRIHPGAIVLLHSTSKTNAEILDELLTKWEEMGYSFGTLEELVASSAKKEP
jgi:peptidoglycan-N-acetylmuramic acid deacetylase